MGSALGYDGASILFAPTASRLWSRTLNVLRTIVGHSMLAAVCVVGIVLCPLLVGFAPLGGDPELMYLPIKVELSRALAAGGLPFWSDRLGLGVPLVAESHAAAFYPPNWIFYRVLDVWVAYRLTMWVHMVGLVVATFAYAQRAGHWP